MKHLPEERGIRESVLKFAEEQYQTKPEYLWKAFPDYAVLRHADNRKWYALLMRVPGEKLGLSGREGYVDVAELKCDPALAGSLRAKQGILPAYHMHREHWITVLLDGTVEQEQILSLVDLSFSLTASRQTRSRWQKAVSRNWLIPANPKYYDLEEAFAGEGITSWKQSSSVAAGDMVYIYLAAPVSAVLYQCRALETDIPYEFDDGKIHMSRVMKLKLLHRYAPGEFSREVLREHGVYAVRGPRGVPESLRQELENRASGPPVRPPQKKDEKA